MNNFTYRTLNANDSSAYRQLRLQALQNNPESFCADYVSEAKLEKLYFQRLLEDQSGNENQHSFMMAAFFDETMIGLCGLTTQSDRLADHSEIIQMYLAPEYRSKGISKKMLSNTLAEAARRRLSKGVVLEVFKSNHSAYQAYLKFGFVTDTNLSNVRSWIMSISNLKV